MTTLRERIAAEFCQAVYAGDPTRLADAILALFQDEAPPSDEWLREVEESARGYTASNRALYDFGRARGYAKAETERAELQRLLDCALAEVNKWRDLATSRVLDLPKERIAELERERDAVRDELREVGEALAWLNGWDGEQLGDEAIGTHDGTPAGIIAALREAARKTKDPASAI